MKLYYSPLSPYARKVRVCAAELGLAGRIELVAVTTGPTTPDRAYARKNPLAKIPALERDDGSILFDSIVICEYLDALAGGGRLFPAAGEPRWQALRLHALADGLLDAALLCRYESVLRPEALRWPEWLAGQSAKVDNALDALEADARTFTGELDIGRINVACALGYLDFRFADRPWRSTRPALAAWFAGVSGRESLASTRPG